MDNQQQNNKKPQMNMPKFNMNWIYGIVIILLITLYLTTGKENSSVHTETSYSDFKTMVMKGYADKIVVNKYSNTLQMYVKPERIREIFKAGTQQTGKNPFLKVQFGSVDQVETFVDKARAEGKFTGDFDYDNKNNGDITTFLLNNLFGLIVLAVVTTSFANSRAFLEFIETLDGLNPNAIIISLYVFAVLLYCGILYLTYWLYTRAQLITKRNP